MQRTLEDCVARYGAIYNNLWLDESKWCEVYSIPSEIKLIGIGGSRQVHIYCNKDMLEALDGAFKNVIDRSLAHELETFDGCLMVRDVRGEPGKPSCHAYALALDFNASKNKLGQVPTMSKELVKCFTDVGFTWGGTFKRLDGMHFSFAWE